MASEFKLPRPGELGYLEQIKKNAMAVEDLARILKLSKRFDSEDEAAVHIRFWLDSSACGMDNQWTICPLCLESGKTPRESNTCLKKPVLSRGEWHPASPEVLDVKEQSFKVLDNESIGEFGPGSIIQFNESFIGCPDCIKFLKIELGFNPKV